MVTLSIQHPEVESRYTQSELQALVMAYFDDLSHRQDDIGILHEVSYMSLPPHIKQAFDEKDTEYIDF